MHVYMSEEWYRECVCLNTGTETFLYTLACIYLLVKSNEYRASTSGLCDSIP